MGKERGWGSQESTEKKSTKVREPRGGKKNDRAKEKKNQEE